MAGQYATNDCDIGSILDDRSSEVEKLASALTERDAEKTAGAIAALIASLATGSAALGVFANTAVQMAFVSPATKRLLAEVAKYEGEQDRATMIARIRDEVELMIGQALIQIMRSQHNISDELMEKLGGLCDAFEQFRGEFEEKVTPHPALLVEKLEVRGGTGVCISDSARSHMRVLHAIVTEGVGFVLN
ncbi:MAG TPA: hypothetical protein VIV60_32760 [Polyangiaceae bacterium]